MRTSIAHGFFLSLLLLSQSIGAKDEKSPLTVRDSISARRVLYGFDYASAVRMSPNDERFLVVLYSGDIERNGNWIEFFSGSTRSFEELSNSRIVARLFTQEHQILALLDTPIIWLDDNRTIAFVWRNGQSPSQVVTLDLVTGELRTITRSSRSVEQFAIDSTATRLIYTTLEVENSYLPASGDNKQKFDALLKNGFAVPDAAFSVAGLLRGFPDDRSVGYYTRNTYVQRVSGPDTARKVDLETFLLPPFKPAISPDGEWALLASTPEALLTEWNHYEDEEFRRNLQIAEKAPNEVNQIRMLWLVNLRNGSVEPLWNVPYATTPEIAWAKNGRSVLLSRTALPARLAERHGWKNDHIAEIYLPSKAAHLVTKEEASRKESRYVGLDARWQPMLKRRSGSHRLAEVTIQEDKNTPPTIVARNLKSGKQKILLEVNPNLANDFTLGRAETVNWTDRQGRAWTGRLYLPIAAQSRAPLVILTTLSFATAPDQFSLRGSELTACVLSIAQPLANRGMAVLVMGQPDDMSLAAHATPLEGKVVVQGYESAIDYLDDHEVIDRKRVGLVGYSRTGFYVQYALTHSKFSFAAAVTADNTTQSYVQYVLSASAWSRNEFERVNGALPIGPGLAQWIENAPGFNADKITTPLRMEINSGGLAGILGQWELFSLLRYLRKPVELYVIPDILHGSHGLLLPEQQIASLGGATDWLDFWLTGHEDVDSSKNEQYARWHRLKNLRSGEAAAN